MTDAKAIEILKNPHDNVWLLTEDLLDSCNFLSVHHRCGSHVAIDYEWDYTIYINLSTHYIIDDGMFNLWRTGSVVLFLENYFEFPLLPTKEEKELFYMEHGFEYPIKTVDIQ